MTSKARQALADWLETSEDIELDNLEVMTDLVIAMSSAHYVPRAKRPWE